MHPTSRDSIASLFQRPGTADEVHSPTRHGCHRHAVPIRRPPSRRPRGTRVHFGQRRHEAVRSAVDRDVRRPASRTRSRRARGRARGSRGGGRPRTVVRGCAGGKQRPRFWCRSPGQRPGSRGSESRGRWLGRGRWVFSRSASSPSDLRVRPCLLAIGPRQAGPPLPWPRTAAWRRYDDTYACPAHASAADAARPTHTRRLHICVAQER